MIYSLNVPATLEDVREVRLLEWHGDVGHRFEAGDLVVELETHKAVFEVRAEQIGHMRARFVEEGDWCPLDAALAVLSDEADEAVPDAPDGLARLPARFRIV